MGHRQKTSASLLTWTLSSIFLTFFVLSFATAEESAQQNPSNVNAQPGESPIEKQTKKEGTALVGRLREKGTRLALKDVRIYLLPHKLKAISEANGNFRFENVPLGPAEFVVNLSGYARLSEKIDVTEKTKEPSQLYLEKLDYDVYETTVVGVADKRDARSKRLSKDEFLKVPGSNGDPVKAVQNLPGVARPQGFSSQVIIEGAAPKNTRYLIDGHEVPIIFHFGGLSSVLFPESIDSVEFLAAGYGPEYGRALGGLVGVRTKAPREDAVRGLGFVDTFQSGAYVEGPIGEKGSFLMAGRISYIGQVLKAAVGENDDFDLSVAPEYSDLIGIYRYRLTARDDLKLVFASSWDTLSFLLDSPVGRKESDRTAFAVRTHFFRFIPQWQRSIGTRRKYRLSLSIGKDALVREIGSDFFNLDVFAYSMRGEWEEEWRPGWRTFLGFDNRYSTSDVRYRLPAAGGAAASSATTSSLVDSRIEKVNEIALYWRNMVEIGRLRVDPSLRLDYFAAIKRGVLQPRLSMEYTLSQSLKIRTAAGNYAQAPEPQEIDINFGNPSLSPTQAIHATVGFEKDFRGGGSRGWLLSSDIFFRDFSNLVNNSSALINKGGTLAPERFNNARTGVAYGVASQLKFDLAPYKGWFSYTISQSRRTDPDDGTYTFQFDQTHVLNALVQTDLGNHWKLSTRVRYITGNALTPILGGVFDSDDDTYRPISGARNADRLPAFFSWDIRVDKQWVFNSWILSLYLDVQNVTNRMNIESRNYNFDFSQSEDVSFLPILPTFGLKGEF